MTMADIVREIQRETEKNRLKKLSNDIDSLIDIARDLLKNAEDKGESGAAEKRIKAYLDMKNLVENLAKSGSLSINGAHESAV